MTRPAVFAVVADYDVEHLRWRVGEVLTAEEWQVGHIGGVRYRAVLARDPLDAYAKAQRGEFA